MNTLKANSKYLVIVDLDSVGPEDVASKLGEAVINANVLYIPMVPGTIQFYEVKRPFWSGRDWAVFRKIYDTIRLKVANMPQRNQLLKEVLEETRRNNTLLREILHHLKPQTLSRSSAVQFKGEKIMANNALVLNVGQTSTATPITFLSDGVTPAGATYSAATYTFSDPSATVVLNPDGLTAIVTGVAASTGAISGSVTFTATDTDGAVSTWVNPFTITTNAVQPPPPPSQLSQSSALQFSVPTP